MDFTPRGSFRLFRVWGISVYLHWTWFAIAFFQVSGRREFDYEVPAWKVAEYVSLFIIVLLHEFGHALACRSVGGRAEQIVLWPLGGIAYVAPPPRPGAFLWSIAAGPLVNVALIVPTFTVWYLARQYGLNETWPDLNRYLTTLTWMNVVLLIFNLLPVYPLDGGQIVFSLLWYVVGRWHSLLIVSVLGMILGGIALAGCLTLLVFYAEVEGIAVFAIMLGLISAFIVLRSLASLHHARSVLGVLALPRNESVRCPECGTSPPRGPYWVCEQCTTRFDVFERKGICPGCGAWHLKQPCPHCYSVHHVDRWLGLSSAPPESEPDEEEV